MMMTLFWGRLSTESFRTSSRIEGHLSPLHTAKGQLSYRCIEQLYQIYIFPMALVVFILQCALHLFILKLIIAEAVETVRKAYQPFA